MNQVKRMLAVFVASLIPVASHPTWPPISQIMDPTIKPWQMALSVGPY